MSPKVDDDGVLTPEELELAANDDQLVELGENRFVVRPDLEGPAIAPAAAADAAGDAPSGDLSPGPGASASAEALAAAPEPHGIDVTLKTDGELAHHRVTSTDVREVFADMLTWYASQLDDDCSPTEALSVLLATTDLE